MGYLIVAALVFAACFGLDKGFTRLFRSKAQHQSGLAVKHNKRTALFGLFLSVLAVAGILSGGSVGRGLFFMSLLILALGVGLITFYLSFGIYYDADSFLFSTFGRKSTLYRFSDIQAQQLYVLQGGNVVVELHMADGRAVSVQSNMEGAYPFLDHAFGAWCRQKGLDPDSCDFHDPSQSLWFPTVEVQ